MIINGNSFVITDTPVVPIVFEHMGILVTEYMVSLHKDFHNTDYKSIAEDITLHLPDISGTYTIYGRLRDSSHYISKVYTCTVQLTLPDIIEHSDKAEKNIDTIKQTYKKVKAIKEYVPEKTIMVPDIVEMKDNNQIDKNIINHKDNNKKKIDIDVMEGTSKHVESEDKPIILSNQNNNIIDTDNTPITQVMNHMPIRFFMKPINYIRRMKQIIMLSQILKNFSREFVYDISLH